MYIIKGKRKEIQCWGVKIDAAVCTTVMFSFNYLAKHLHAERPSPLIRDDALCLPSAGRTENKERSGIFSLKWPSLITADDHCSATHLAPLLDPLITRGACTRV